MKSLSDFPIRVKVMLPPAILALGLLFLYTFTIIGLKQINTTIETISGDILKRIALIDEIVILSEQVQSDVFQISVLKSMDLGNEVLYPIQSRLETRLNDLNVRYGQIINHWQLDPTEEDLLSQIAPPLNEFRHQTLQAAEVVIQNPGLGVVLVHSSTVPFANLQQLLSSLREHEEELISQAENDFEDKARSMTTIVAIGSLVITLIAISITMMISTSHISRPIMAMTMAMKQLANNTLDIQVGDLKRLDEIGEMARVLSFFRDNMIAKEQSEEQLLESQRAMAALLDNLPGFAYRCENDKNWTMNFISDGCQAITGYTPQNFLNNNDLPYAEIIHPEDREMVWVKIQNALKIKSPFQLEYRIITASGEEKWVWEHGSGLFGEHGKVRFLEGYITDISERKNFENALEQRIFTMEQMNDLYVGREGRMIELKKEVNDLLKELDRPPKYTAPSRVDQLRRR